MPKKRTPSYAQTKPNYVHPSLQSSRSTAPPHPSSPQTVNERIQQLRREAAPRATTERRDEVTEVVTQRTAPPEIRRILHMAEVDAPRPKPGSSRATRSTRAGARPPPGPAAPSSWLNSSIYAPEHLKGKNERGFDRDRPSRFCELAKVHDEEYKRFPPRGSLVHHCLKTFALHWEELAEYEQHYIPSLPAPLREALLSYLTIYGEKSCLDLATFKILFGKGEDVDAGSGTSGVHFLDLTGLLNSKYTLKDLDKSLPRKFSTNGPAETLAKLSISDQKGKQPQIQEDVLESWEDADEFDNGTPLPDSINIPMFGQLTRLSLGHPGPQASWTDLLNATQRLNTLTHLSLAYWPTPSTTPNATTTSMVSKEGRSVALGGRHFYSELDDDWAEAANILRRLSHNTYCLKWLDLEGCKWHKALIWDYPHNPRPGTGAGAGGRFGGAGRGGGGTADWVRDPTSPGPDWAGAWRQIEYLNLFQGWIPKDQQSVMALPAGTAAVQLLGWLREHRNDPRYKFKFKSGPGYHAVDWLEGEKTAKAVGSEIMQQRKAGRAGGYCFVDHGWTPSTVTPRTLGPQDNAGVDSDED